MYEGRRNGSARLDMCRGRRRSISVRESEKMWLLCDVTVCERRTKLRANRRDKNDGGEIDGTWRQMLVVVFEERCCCWIYLFWIRGISVGEMARDCWIYFLAEVSEKFSPFQRMVQQRMFHKMLEKCSKRKNVA